MNEPVDHQADTWSSINHQMVKFTHRFEVDNFNFYCKCTTTEDDHQKIKSPNFSPPNDSTLQFYISLYPKGEDEDAKDHASLFLFLSSCPKPEARVQWKVSIIDQQNIKQNSKIFLKKYKTKGDGRGWGWGKFITHEKLNELLTNDKLIIFSEIEAMVDSISTTSYMSSSSQDKQVESQVLDNLGQLFENRKLKDVVLVAGDSKTEHRAHRTILAARSSVFASMFEHDTKERNEGRVVISDIDGDVIEEMLRFIYTGKVLKLDELADRLLIAADKYELELLKDICEKYIIDNLSKDTVLAMLIIADRHSAPQLRSKSIEYINKNLPLLTETSHWKAIKDKPELYFELFSKVITENPCNDVKSNSPSASSADNKMSSFTFLSIFSLVVIATFYINYN